MHGNQWVLKIAVLKYYSVSKRGTTAKSNPKQATDPISLHTKFGDNSSNTFPLNERKPCVTPDIGRRTPDIGHRTAKKAKIIYPPPRGVDIISDSGYCPGLIPTYLSCSQSLNGSHFQKHLGFTALLTYYLWSHLWVALSFWVYLTSS